MDLEKITAKIQPRKSWQAIDLGVVLVQQHWQSLYKIWLLTSLPFLFFLIPLTYFFNYAFLLLWLVKPLLERPLLHFISRSLFSEELSVKECVKASFSLIKIQWILSLTWRRLSFTRSFDLPILQLEGLKGKERTKRLRIIHSRGTNASVWLTILFFFTELFFYTSLFVLVYLFLPQHMQDINFFTSLFSADLITLLLIYMAMTVIAPFYVVCGFSLYINQRTELEAWDIELTFKSLAKRLQKKSEHQSVRLAGFLLLGSLLSGLLFLPSNHLQAEEAQTVTESFDKQEDSLESKVTDEAVKISPIHQKAKETIEKIKQDKDFHNKVKDYRYEPVNKPKTKKNTDFSAWEKFFYWFGKIVAFLVEFGLWVFLALLIIFLIMRYGNFLGSYKREKTTKTLRPKKLFGLDLESGTLPDKPWTIAYQLIEKGEYRQALSLLYRASLIWYMDNTKVTIKQGDTELEVLRKISDFSSKDKNQLMTDLTMYWRNLAYAHQTPDKNQLCKLCETWPNILKSQDESHSHPVSDGTQYE